MTALRAVGGFLLVGELRLGAQVFEHPWAGQLLVLPPNTTGINSGSREKITLEVHLRRIQRSDKFQVIHLLPRVCL